MTAETPKELMRQAMALGEPRRVPVMCQLAIGHTLLQSRVHPVDYFMDNEAYAAGLLAMRDLYDFDGVLIHKPGREPAFTELVTSIDRDADTPRVLLDDGSCVECRRDDDPYYRPADNFRRPDITGLDPDHPLAWAPESFLRWCRHKGTALYRTPEEIPDYWYGCIDRVLAAVGDTHSVHGEVRAPFDHFLNIVGMEAGLIALIAEPDRTHALMNTLTDMAVAWAVAQVRRGCVAIKISSPYAGAGFISRGQYRQWIVPYEQRVTAAVRQENAFVYTHTCGAISDRLEDMMSTGINGIECLDPPPLGNVELDDALRRTKGRIFIKGNLDSVNSLLGKNAESVRRDVRRMVKTAAPGGAYICSTACSIAPRVEPGNVKAMVETAREFKY